MLVPDDAPVDCPESYQGVGDDRCWECPANTRCPFKDRTYYPTRLDAEKARGLGERIYYKAGYGYYIIKPVYGSFVKEGRTYYNSRKGAEKGKRDNQQVFYKQGVGYYIKDRPTFWDRFFGGAP